MLKLSSGIIASISPEGARYTHPLCSVPCLEFKHSDGDSAIYYSGPKLTRL